MVEEKKDVNTEESSASENDGTQEESSTSENTDVTEESSTPEEKSIPYNRFKEVNDNYKTERQKREDLEARLAEIESMKKDTPEKSESVQEEKDEFVEETIKEYTDAGIEPKVAKLLALKQWKMAQRQGEMQSQKAMKPLIEKYNNEQITAKVNGWKSNQKDLTPEVESDMIKLFNSYPEEKKLAIWNLGEEGFDMLKSKVLTQKSDTPQQNKKLGQSIGKPKGKSSNTDFKSWTQEEVTEWLKTNPSEEDYEKYANAVGLRS